MALPMMLCWVLLLLLLLLLRWVLLLSPARLRLRYVVKLWRVGASHSGLTQRAMRLQFTSTQQPIQLQKFALLHVMTVWC
jgi:hypothetical protein